MNLALMCFFSCVPENEISKVYPVEKVPNLRVVNVLTGYVPEQLLRQSVLPVSERSIDVGYRTRRMPFWLGRLGHEKWFIAEEFKRHASSINLNLDLFDPGGVSDFTVMRGQTLLRHVEQ